MSAPDTRPAPAGPPARLLEPPSSERLGELAADTELLAALEEDLVVHPRQELFATDLRRHLGALFDAAGALPPPAARLAQALARQGFANEYAFYETEEEEARIAGWKRRLVAAADGPEPSPSSDLLLLWAMYRPVHGLPDLERLAETAAAGSPLAELVPLLLDQPREEERLASELPALVGRPRPGSAPVRDQYTANPYPRWLRLDRRHPDLRDLSAKVTAPASTERLFTAGFEVLVPGCGTGHQPISMALANPEARVVATDLSRPALAYGRRMARRLGVDNVEFVAADLLDLGAWRGRFAFVSCTGVLHTLEDPIAGWRLLSGLLAPGGLLKVGLYGRRGRLPATLCREYVRRLGLRPTPAEMRRLRRRLLTDGRLQHLGRALAIRDFYSLSGFRDLCFAARERSFTISELAAAVREVGLALVHFEIGVPDLVADFQRRHPEPEAMRDLDLWQRFEEEHAPVGHLGLYFLLLQRPRSAVARGLPGP